MSVIAPFTKRKGLVVTAITTYATAVYFSYLFLAQRPNDEGNSDNIRVENNDCCTACYTEAKDRTETFQKIAKIYDDQISRDEFVMGLPLLRRSLLHFHARGEVLEVGAGTGRNLNYYPIGQVKEVVLTDVSDQMLLQAREKIIELNKKNNSSFFSKSNDKDGGPFKVFVADATNMTKFYKGNTFDTIVSTFTLCSFDDPVEVLRELQTICKPDGKILLLEHGRSKSFQGLSNYLDINAERHAKNWGCVWNRDLDEILDKAGLEVEHIYTWHFGTTYYIVCRPSSKVKEERKLGHVLKKETNPIDENETLVQEKDMLWKRMMFTQFWDKKDRNNK